MHTGVERLPRASQKGAATLEMAIVLLLVVMLTVGVLDFALGVRAYNSIAYAAREGARYASVHSRQSRDPATADKIAARVLSQLVLVNESTVQVSAVWTPTNTRGSTVRVDVSYPYQTMTRLLPFRTLNLTSSSQTIISE